MLNCRDATALISQAQDRKLPFRTRLALRFHILMCRLCHRFEHQIRFLRDAMRRRPDSGPTLPAEARERLQDTLRRAAAAEASDAMEGDHVPNRDETS